ncbi:MAG: hypothetical protein HZY77_16255 [Thiobacillus sp.]|nr:MAG: hypothetical protein HZY77_16255 [Thiobacillus sp.]
MELEVSRDGDDRTLTVSKLKEGVDGAQYGFKLLEVPLGMDEDGEVYGSCVVEHGPVAAKVWKPKGRYKKRCSTPWTISRGWPLTAHRYHGRRCSIARSSCRWRWSR